MLHSKAIDSIFWEVGTAEKILKTRSLNGAFCCNMESMTCLPASLV